MIFIREGDLDVPIQQLSVSQEEKINREAQEDAELREEMDEIALEGDDGEGQEEDAVEYGVVETSPNINGGSKSVSK